MKKLFLTLSILLFIKIGFSQTNSGKLSTAALELTKDKVTYDPRYF